MLRQIVVVVVYIIFFIIIPAAGGAYFLSQEMFGAAAGWATASEVAAVYLLLGKGPLGRFFDKFIKES